MPTSSRDLGTPPERFGPGDVRDAYGKFLLMTNLSETIPRIPAPICTSEETRRAQHDGSCHYAGQRSQPRRASRLKLNDEDIAEIEYRLRLPV